MTVEDTNTGLARSTAYEYAGELEESRVEATTPAMGAVEPATLAIETDEGHVLVTQTLVVAIDTRHRGANAYTMSRTTFR